MCIRDRTKSTKTSMFQKEFPERHFNVGIAEADLMGTAAGFATCGKIPFASTFAMFAAGRAFEQIRNTIAYPKLNVKIAPTHAGISVGEDGGSHESIEAVSYTHLRHFTRKEKITSITRKPTKKRSLCESLYKMCIRDR